MAAATPATTKHSPSQSSTPISPFLANFLSKKRTEGQIIADVPPEPSNDFFLQNFTQEATPAVPGTSPRGGTPASGAHDEDDGAVEDSDDNSYNNSNGDVDDCALPGALHGNAHTPFAVALPTSASKVGSTRGSSARSGNTSHRFPPPARYFAPDLTTRCYNCGLVGHRAAECTNERMQKPCFLCARVGHEASRCPEALCFNCLGTGHTSRECRYPRRRKPDICLVCGASGHNECDTARCEEVCRALKGELQPVAADDLCSASESVLVPLSCSALSLSCIVCGALDPGSNSARECCGVMPPPPPDNSVYCAKCARAGHSILQCPDLRHLHSQMQWSSASQNGNTNSFGAGKGKGKGWLRNGQGRGGGWGRGNNRSHFTSVYRGGSCSAQNLHVPRNPVAGKSQGNAKTKAKAKKPKANSKSKMKKAKARAKSVSKTKAMSKEKRKVKQPSKKRKMARSQTKGSKRQKR